MLALITHPALLLAQEIFRLPEEAKVATKDEFRIQTEAGNLPLKSQVVSGQLPPGIELLPSRTLTGTHTSPHVEPFKFVLDVSDSSQPPQSVTQQLSLAVAAGRLRILPGEGPIWR